MFEQISMFELLNPVESRFTYECKRGSGFEDGRVRIYCASLNLDVKGLAAFCKKEYGIGGHSSDFPDGGRGFADHNAQGIIIHDWNEKTDEKHDWLEVAKEIKRLIAMNDYLTEKEYARVKFVSKRSEGIAPMPIPRVRIEAVLA